MSGKRVGMMGIIRGTGNRMLFMHLHIPVKFSGRRIAAGFRKENLPEGTNAVESEGKEAICRCGEWLIVHDQPERFAEECTMLERADRCHVCQSANLSEAEKTCWDCGTFWLPGKASTINS